MLGSNTAGSYANARWNSASADVSGTIHLSDRLRLVETFRFRNFSVAGDYQDFQSNYFGAAGLGSGTLLSPVATFPTTILSHSSGSPADIINETTINMIGQNSKENDFQVQYDVTHSFGVRGGFVWGQDTIQPGNTYQASLG